MAGKKGRSGRRRRSTSWWRNPTALAGHHLNVLIEAWLGGVPIQIGRPLAKAANGAPIHGTAENQMGTGCDRNSTRDEERLRGRSRAALNVADVLAWARRRAPSVTLRRAARSTPRDEREVAYEEYLDNLTTAWKK